MNERGLRLPFPFVKLLQIHLGLQTTVASLLQIFSIGMSQPGWRDSGRPFRMLVSNGTKTQGCESCETIIIKSTSATVGLRAALKVGSPSSPCW